MTTFQKRMQQLDHGETLTEYFARSPRNRMQFDTDEETRDRQDEWQFSHAMQMTRREFTDLEALRVSL